MAKTRLLCIAVTHSNEAAPLHRGMTKGKPELRVPLAGNLELLRPKIRKKGKSLILCQRNGTHPSALRGKVRPGGVESREGRDCDY